MPAGLLVRLRPTGPWRIGPDSGARDRVDHIYHSDTLFSAVTAAGARLGWMEEWLEETVHAAAGPRVSLTSMFPWQQDWLYVVPPRHLWPPHFFSKLRARGACFVPAALAGRLARHEHIDEDDWMVDGHSECLISRGRGAALTGPFRVALRNGAAVDRLTQGAIALHQTACLEFAPGAGLWCAAVFQDADAASRWDPRLRSAFRLLADSGFGGKRACGWGQCEIASFKEGDLAGLVLPDAPVVAPPAAESPAETDAAPPPVQETLHWLLSLYNPAADDLVDWQRGSYRLVRRSGRVESPQGWGAPKQPLRMVTEGSVLAAPAPPRGRAPNVAPEGFPHPVFRAGFAVSLPLQGRASQ